MNIWNLIPFFRLLLPFLAGILAAILIPFEVPFPQYTIPAFFLPAGAFILFKKLNVNFKYAWTFGTLVTLLLFFCGAFITQLHTEHRQKDHFSKTTGNENTYLLQTSEAVLEKERSYKVPVNVLGMKDSEGWKSVSGQAICYFEKDSLSKKIKYGDCLLATVKFKEVSPPKNPGEFNYKRYLSFHNIYHQAYIPSESWQATDHNLGNPIIRFAKSLREQLLSIYTANGISGQEFAVGAALVLGYTDQLDQDLISAYASSGALHVLSVSGLHVGIIYILFNYLLSFMDKYKRGKFIKMVLLLFILWFYALLTGLSPSVLRSAAMFSFVVVAQTWKYQTNIFNTLAASCFALLLYNPYLIMEVGFQLSYLAVLGIITLQPWLYERWQPRWRVLDQIWLITTVSIAAQAATFPLGLLYFHQFPNYFLISNLIVIPLSTLILGYGLLLFILGSIPAIAVASSKLFTGMVWLLNECVRLADQAPGALISGISISIFETWLIYAILLSVICFIYLKQTRYLVSTLCFLTGMLVMQFLEAIRTNEQNTLIVYNVPGRTACDLISGSNTVFLADTSLKNDSGRMLFHILHNRWDRNIKTENFITLESKEKYSSDCFRRSGNYLQFRETSVVMINNSLQRKDSSDSKRFDVDIILLSDNPKIRISELLKLYQPKKIIADSSNPEWKCEQWEKECTAEGIAFHSVPGSGAYVQEI